MSGPTPSRPRSRRAAPRRAIVEGASTDAGRPAERRRLFRAAIIVALVGLVAVLGWLLPGIGGDAALARERTRAESAIGEVDLATLPVQVRETLTLIRSGGPFPYRKDGSVFMNRERVLPPRPRGHYTEYTVPTPRARDRGARRVIAAGEPTRTNEFYYTDDHYTSFRRIREPG